MSDNTVSVTARSYFRGEPGEGDNGMVKPGDKLSVSRQRAADLKANGLIDAPDASLPASTPASPAGQASTAPAAPPPGVATTAKIATAPANPAPPAEPAKK